MNQLAIIGSGPAGYTAAIYAARANLAPVLFTGKQTGGQLTTTNDVENYPGFPDGVNGTELMNLFERQSTRFGTVVKSSCVVTRITRRDGGFTVNWTDMLEGVDASADYQTVIVATGASVKYLGLPGEEEFFPPIDKKAGLSGCAVCDGALPLYRNQPVVVVGGGDTASEESSHMTKFASVVYLLHRRDSLRASKIMADRVLSNPKIKPLWNSALVGYITDEKGRMAGITVEDVNTKARRQVDVKGVFMAIGHTPNTQFLRDSDLGLTFDESGYLVVEHGCHTSVPGLFAAGDVRDRKYRQAVTAAGMGCMAALEAEHYLGALKA